MLKLEKKLINWVEKHIYIISFVIFTLIAAIIRFIFRYYESADYVHFLSPWYNTIKENGGLNALNKQVGNYGILYQFMIAIGTYFPIRSIFLYKLISILFDFILGGAVGYVVYQLSPIKKKWNGLAAYTVMLLMPTIILNSAAWAQCDSIYTSFIVIAIYLLLKERYKLSFIFIGIAFAFKLQAIFIIPFFIITYFMKKNFSIINFLFIPLSMCIITMPALLIGKRSIFDIFLIYFEQADYYHQIYLNYPSFLVLFSDQVELHYDMLSSFSLIITISILAMMMIYIIVKKIIMNSENMLYIAFITTYTCVLFLPSMHERYDYLYVILGIIILFINNKTLFPFLGLVLIPIFTYSHYLFYVSIDLKVLTLLNVIVYISYCYILKNKMNCRI